MKLQILDLAVHDLIDGYRFYEKQEQGIGDYFLDCLFADIDSLRLHGGIHAKVYKDFHRSLSTRFPFAIYYTVDGETIYVRSVVDCRRRPAWIRQHLRQSIKTSPKESQ